MQVHIITHPTTSDNNCEHSNYLSVWVANNFAFYVFMYILICLLLTVVLYNRLNKSKSYTSTSVYYLLAARIEFYIYFTP